MTKVKEAELKRLFAPVQFKIIEAKADDEEMILEAYVSIFGNVDLGGDIIERGAFAESLGLKFPKGVWSHNWDEPIAKTLEAREDEKGLYIKAQFIKGVQKAEEAYLLIKEGVIDEFSIGFRTLDDEWDEAGHRIIKKARLYEWSPVLAGMNPLTSVESIKSAEGEEEKEEEEVKEEKVVQDFVFDTINKIMILRFEDETEESFKMNDEFFNRSKAQLKVGLDNREGKATRSRENEKILRIKQATKRAKLANEYVLRIVSNL